VRLSPLLSLLCGTALLAGCAVGPEYQRPAADVPPEWKLEAPWRDGNPNDAAVKGNWWELFGDSQLNALEQQALAQNQTLHAASAHLQQARDLVTVSASALFPQIGLAAGAARERSSANRPLSSYSIPNTATVQNDFRLDFAVSYEADLFGRVRREVEGARAAAEQARADFENTRLVLTSDLAADYFNLRELDAEIDTVRQSIDLQRRAFDLVSARHDLGAAPGLDVAQQQAQLDTTATQVDLLRNQRAQYEHALATLVGTPAPSFAVEQGVSITSPPVIPVGLPSDLLERRPDVASAERAMAAANAQIGVARAAFFPSIMLSPDVGWESRAFSSLLSAPSLLWSVGVSAAQTLFDAGKTRANVNFTQAGYDAAVANYRHSVLTAMQEVENGITGLATLGRASAEADAAVKDTQRVLDLATDRYTGGIATYLDVVTAQQGLLTNQRQAVQILGQQLLTSVYLLKALGGGWQATGSTAYPGASEAGRR